MVHGDDYGLVLPPKIAPKQVSIVPIRLEDELLNKCDEISKLLREKGITNYVDKTDKSAGFKFAESEVNGIPVRIEIGPRDLKDGKVTIVRRDSREKEIVNINDILDKTIYLLDDIQKSLYNKAKKLMEERTFRCNTFDEMKEIMDKNPGFVYAPWCGKEECEVKIKEIRGTKSRCITDNKVGEHDKCVACGEKAKHEVVWGLQY